MTNNNDKMTDEAIMRGFVGAIAGAVGGALTAMLRGKKSDEVLKDTFLGAVAGGVTGTITGAAAGANDGNEVAQANVFAATAGAMVKEGLKTNN